MPKIKIWLLFANYIHFIFMFIFGKWSILTKSKTASNLFKFLLTSTFCWRISSLDLYSSRKHFASWHEIRCLYNNGFLYNSNYSCELSMVLTGAAFFHKVSNLLLFKRRFLGIVKVRIAGFGYDSRWMNKMKWSLGCARTSLWVVSDNVKA